MKAVLFSLLLVGCAMTEKPPVKEIGAGDCKAEPASSLVGQPVTAELGAEAVKLTGARTIRWILPGHAVTMDYRQDRLNIAINGAYKVERVTCG